VTGSGCLGVSDDSSGAVEDGSLPRVQDRRAKGPLRGLLAEFAHANAAAAPKDPSPSIASSARNRFAGLFTKVVTDNVIVTGQMHCGPC